MEKNKKTYQYFGKYKNLNIFETEKCSYELMHCVSTYPMKTSDANLVTINSLKKEFNCNVGYSGHENGIAISIAASDTSLHFLSNLYWN